MKRNRRSKVEIARSLRRNQTEPEQRIWRLLKNSNLLGYKFRRQHILNGFILDFYCPSARLGIEVDGGAHLKQKDYDRSRQDLIEKGGIKILRFKNKEVFDHGEKVLETIINNIEKGPSPQSGEGGPSSRSDWDDGG